MKNMERNNICPNQEHETLTDEKKKLREHHKYLRDTMSSREVAEKSEKICKSLLEAEWYAEAELVCAYYPLGKEVDCRAFLQKALLDGKQIALPRTRRDRSMEFYRIASFAQLKEGSFHVWEPESKCPLVQSNHAVVLVPGVAFDCNGNRCGYGKGYYDRYFSRFPRLLRYALSYENQVEEQIKVLPTDVKMHRIYTEEKLYPLNLVKRKVW